MINFPNLRELFDLAKDHSSLKYILPCLRLCDAKISENFDQIRPEPKPKGVGSFLFEWRLPGSQCLRLPVGIPQLTQPSSDGSNSFLFQFKTCQICRFNALMWRCMLCV